MIKRFLRRIYLHSLFPLCFSSFILVGGVSAGYMGRGVLEHNECEVDKSHIDEVRQSFYSFKEGSQFIFNQVDQAYHQCIRDRFACELFLKHITKPE